MLPPSLYPVPHFCCICGCHHGNGWHSYGCALSATLLPAITPLSVPTQFIFDAVDDLSKMYLNKNGPVPSNFAPFQYAD
jgi:hypothetical protein